MGKEIYKMIMKDKGEKDRSPLTEGLYDIRKEDIQFLSLNSVTLNLLYSGRVKGGIPIGHISMISAPSQLGKSFIAMQVIKNAQNKNMNVIVIDTERAFKSDMANTLNISLSEEDIQIFRLNKIEKVESIIVAISENLTPEERNNTLFVLDSWGTLITSKAVKDSLTGNDVTDMTEAKKKNRLANIMLDTGCTFFVVNHVYDNTGGFGDPLKIPGGKRLVFNSEEIVLGMSMAKERNKTTRELEGNIITAKTYKSRFCKSEIRLQYRLKFNGGLDPFYGILPDAMEGGYVIKPKAGYYSRAFMENDKPVKENNLYTVDFWKPIFKETDFEQYLENKYTYEKTSIVDTEKEFLSDLFS